MPATIQSPAIGPTPTPPTVRRPAKFGRLLWIGVRPARGAPMRTCEWVEAIAGLGLVGDRYARNGNRQVTLVQAEHLPLIAALSGQRVIAADLLRRNLLVCGIEWLALQHSQFCIGEVLLQGSGPCEPCAKLERALGVGSHQALVGYGGICARIVRGGRMALGDRVQGEPSGSAT